MCKRILKSETSNTGDIPFYKIGTFGGKANAYITKELFEKYKSQYSYPKKGDILISAAGTIGKTVIYDGKPAYYQDSNIVWIDNDEKLVLNRFLFYAYQLNPWQVSTGGTIVVCHAKRKKLTSKIQKNPPEKKLPGGFKTYLNGFIMPF